MNVRWNCRLQSRSCLPRGTVEFRVILIRSQVVEYRVMVSVIQAEFTLFGRVYKKDDGWFYAHCPPLDITTQGRTESEAKQNLEEASQFFFISCIERGTLDQALRELGFERVESRAVPVPRDSFKMVIPVPLRFKPQPCHV